MIPDLSTTSAIGPSPRADELDRLAKILDEYLWSLERGTPIAPAELVERHPEMADQLRKYLSGLALFHDAVGRPLPIVPPASGDGQNQELRDLGDFRLVREIGRGGMGVVYEAVQVSLGRRVAVKVLPFSLAFDAEFVERFQREARTAAQLEHPNIIPIYDFGEHEGQPYFTMRLVSGRTLDVDGDVGRAHAEVAQLDREHRVHGLAEREVDDEGERPRAAISQ